MEKSFKIISWNVNGIRAALNKGFNQTISDLDADIFCVQETKADGEIMKSITKQFAGYEVYSNSALKKGYSGTAVLTRQKPLRHFYGMNIDEHDQEGRLITLEYETFYLVNAYVPNSGANLVRLDYRKKWDAKLLEYLKKLDAEKPLIFTGDLNVAHEPIDLARPKPNYNKSAGYTQTEIDGFKNFLQAGFIDTFRYFHKDKVQYTFWNVRFNARAKNVGWRIDYFLVSEKIMEQCKESFILDDIMGSDHCPVGLITDV